MTEDESIKRLTDEIRLRIEILRRSGQLSLLKDVLGDDLRDIASGNDGRKMGILVGITVTDDIRIIMPGMGGMEIKMPTLARALYVFYLIHSEGVAYKHLSDYRRQLFCIYRKASNRSDEHKLNDTINRLVNPLSNKVNECASRIKDAFVKAFGEDAASLYYLTNTENSDDALKKNVKLPASFISLPDSLF